MKEVGKEGDLGRAQPGQARGPIHLYKTFYESNEAFSGLSSLRFALEQALSDSEGSLCGEPDPSLSLRMTQRDGSLFE